MKKEKRIGQIVAILSLILLVYDIFFLKNLYVGIGSIIVGIIGVYIGWLI